MSTIKGLEATIAEAAKKQANNEWDEFEQLAADWHRGHKAGSHTLRKHDYSYYRDYPPCRLDTSVNNDMAALLKNTLKSYSTAWREARAAIIIREKSKKLLRQVELIEGGEG